MDSSVCPGMHFAEIVVWSTIVSILATTTIRRPLDKNGKEYAPPAEFTGALLRYLALPIHLERILLTPDVVMLSISSVALKSALRVLSHLQRVRPLHLLPSASLLYQYTLLQGHVYPWHNIP